MKTAVVLFNLGGPDSLNAVRPFLFNLFFDKAIIRLPLPVRLCVATLISSLRTKKAKAIYEKMGGRSPILPETEKQAKALEASLGANYKTFIVMRYWQPRAKDVAKKIKNYAPDQIILLPLYPQFSTTTTASSIKEWDAYAAKNKITANTRTICCYPLEQNYINAHVARLKETLKNTTNARVLFSAHGLPKKIVDAGDPYQWQVEQNAKAVLQALGETIDYSICYQSRVGPMEWIGPSTDAEILRAGADGKNIILVPIAFVSEHSETLVELDIEYRHLAESVGVKHYVRIPTLSADSQFIESLKQLVLNEKACEKRFCPTSFKGCFHG